MVITTKRYKDLIAKLGRYEAKALELHATIEQQTEQLNDIEYLEDRIYELCSQRGLI